MYVDESGGTDETVTSEDVTVTVEGQDYEVEKNIDLDGDGDVDAALVDNPDGTRSAYIDDDADGDADSYVEVDERGNVLAEARFDERSGRWIAVDPSAPAGPEHTSTDTQTSDTSTGGSMTADMPQGEIEVGPPTIDTNDDGVNDTAVTEDAEGNTFYFTDANADGEADYVVVVEADGSTVALEHTGDGAWEPVEADATPTSGMHGSVDNTDTGTTDAGTERGIGTGVAAAAGPGAASSVVGVAKIDPFTGQWMSPN